ncbi:MAG TPA: ABC transporter permease [Longimicrobiales bacterium]|nr:ABC transporter permease [Longimicrobiales bacterium]
MNRTRLMAIARKELRQLRRDPPTLGMMFGVPVIQLLLFGFAIRTDVRDLPLAIYDAAPSSESRELAARLEATGNYRIAARANGYDEAHEWLTEGRVRAALIIPPDYARRLLRGERAPAQLLIDAADPMASQSAIAAAGTLALATLDAATGTASLLEPAARGRGSIDLRVRPLYNPGLRTPTYIVPGIIGVLLSLTLMLITSLALVRERERGTLEQLIVTPITRSELMVGKVAPYVVIGYVQMTAVLLLGWLVFDVPVRGSLTLFYVISLAFIIANLGLGLFFSTVARNQQQAMMLGFMFLLPNILLSGFMFPREAMPEAAQWLGAALPLTYYLEVLRGIILRDAGLAALWQETAILAGFALLLLGGSVVRFSKTLE